MSLLRNIQKSICVDHMNLAPTLLQLHLLATKLSCKELEHWIRFESEGYPDNVDVPRYRTISPVYEASLVGPNSYFNNIPIPSLLMEKHAGKQWLAYSIRHSISVIEDFIKSQKQLRIDASNLTFSLTNKIYENHTCTSVTGIFPAGTFRKIQNAVRHRILDFTSKLEQSVPSAIKIHFDHDIRKNTTEENKTITKIFNQTINIGECNIQTHIEITQGDKLSLVKYLISNNFPKEDAEEFSNIVSSEKPDSSHTPIGKKAQKWLDQNLPKISKFCKTTTPIMEWIKEAVAIYYGL